jgi:transcriptional regulator with XRE-family HTH domain
MPLWGYHLFEVKPDRYYLCNDEARAYLTQGVTVLTGLLRTQDLTTGFEFSGILVKRRPKMGRKLNPDGAKIRALRIRRGWTQEQLAEIAGVSPRTIQRAETAGRAAFDTLRAIAGAFEEDFDHLLKSETCAVCDPVPRSGPRPASAAAPILEPDEPIPLTIPRLSFGRTWTTLWVAAALAAGLLTGVILTYWFHTPAPSRFSAIQLTSVDPAQAGARFETLHPNAGAAQTPGVLRTVPNPATYPTIPDRKAHPVAAMLRHQDYAGQAAKIFQAADLTSQTTIPSSPQPASLDLPLRSRELPAILAIPEEADAWNPACILPGDLSQNDQGTGAVRQAVGQAAKKTGGVFAKVGASIRRVF